MPGEDVELPVAGSGWVRLELAWSEEDAYALVAKLGDCPLERTPGGERGIDEWQDHHGTGQADGLGQDAEGVSVADPPGALVDCVVGGRGDDHRVRLQRTRL